MESRWIVTELEKYKAIGTVEECKRAVAYWNQNNKPRHYPNENCKTCAKHNGCYMESYSSWCIWYESKNFMMKEG